MIAVNSTLKNATKAILHHNKNNNRYLLPILNIEEAREIKMYVTKNLSQIFMIRIFDLVLPLN